MRWRSLSCPSGRLNPWIVSALAPWLSVAALKSKVSLPVVLDEVLAEAADQAVVAASAVDGIVAEKAGQRVVAGKAVDGVAEITRQQLPGGCVGGIDDVRGRGAVDGQPARIDAKGAEAVVIPGRHEEVRAPADDLRRQRARAEEFKRSNRRHCRR